MVTGGYFFTSDFVTTYLDSTEVLIKDAFSWKVLKKKPLPQPMAKMGIISFQNKIFIIGIGMIPSGAFSFLNILYLGGYYNDGTALDYILSFNTTSSEWNQIGSISQGRYKHAVSTVQQGEVLQFCETDLD